MTTYPDTQRRSRGRPTKLTPALQERYVAAIRRGATHKMAAAVAGVDFTQIARWMRRGEQPGAAAAEFRQFRHAAIEAEAETAMRMVDAITTAAATDWRAALAFLERRHSDEWGNRERIDIRVRLTNFALVQARELGLDESEALAEVERVLHLPP